MELSPGEEGGGGWEWQRLRAPVIGELRAQTALWDEKNVSHSLKFSFYCEKPTLRSSATEWEDCEKEQCIHLFTDHELVYVIDFNAHYFVNITGYFCHTSHVVVEAVVLTQLHFCHLNNSSQQQWQAAGGGQQQQRPQQRCEGSRETWLSVTVCDVDVVVDVECDSLCPEKSIITLIASVRKLLRGDHFISIVHHNWKIWAPTDMRTTNKMQK